MQIEQYVQDYTFSFLMLDEARIAEEGQIWIIDLDETSLIVSPGDESFIVGKRRTLQHHIAS